MRTTSLAGLLSLVVFAQTATADPILYSTSGQFDIAAGTLVLAGVTDASPSANILLGSVSVGQVQGPLGVAPFHIQFQFSGGLPSIDLSGTVPFSLGYNGGQIIENPAVTTTATTAQAGLYPAIFQEMLAHPDWVRTTSFRSDERPTMEIGLSVRPFDPSEPVVVPEPASALVFAAGLAACGYGVGRARRRGGA
jgi:hypothetical protein